MHNHGDEPLSGKALPALSFLYEKKRSNVGFVQGDFVTL